MNRISERMKRDPLRSPNHNMVLSPNSVCHVTESHDTSSSHLQLPGLSRNTSSIQHLLRSLNRSQGSNNTDSSVDLHARINARQNN